MLKKSTKFEIYWRKLEGEVAETKGHTGVRKESQGRNNAHTDEDHTQKELPRSTCQAKIQKYKKGWKFYVLVLNFLYFLLFNMKQLLPPPVFSLYHLKHHENQNVFVKHYTSNYMPDPKRELSRQKTVRSLSANLRNIFNQLKQIQVFNSKTFQDISC